MKKLNLLHMFLPMLLLIIGCSGSDDNGITNEFEVPKLLADATNTLILPTISNFKTETNTFNDLTTTYINNPRESNLDLLRAQWIKTALAYERTYVFHIGVARDRFLHQAIYNWPTVANAIEDFIANNEVNQETLAPISPQIKALAGIEYLLFKSSVAATNEEFANDEKRREYLKLSSEFLKSQADRLHDIWDEAGEGYATTFIDSDETGIKASFNLFFNGLNNAVDTGKVTKIGKPGGFETSPNANPELVQAPFSDLSLELLSVSLDMVEEAFFTEDGTNVSDYIFFILKENSLNEDLQAKINEVKSAISAITIPLEEAVIDTPSEVENLHTKLTELGILISVDVRSVLSVIITSTDNDGD